MRPGVQVLPSKKQWWCLSFCRSGIWERELNSQDGESGAVARKLHPELVLQEGLHRLVLWHTDLHQWQGDLNWFTMLETPLACSSKPEWPLRYHCFASPVKIILQTLTTHPYLQIHRETEPVFITGANNNPVITWYSFYFQVVLQFLLRGKIEGGSDFHKKFVSVPRFFHVSSWLVGLVFFFLVK